MKKAVIIGLLLILFVNIGGKASSSVIIPEDAIRFRIIANSNQDIDIKTKMEVYEAILASTEEEKYESIISKMMEEYKKEGNI